MYDRNDDDDQEKKWREWKRCKGKVWQQTGEIDKIYAYIGSTFFTTAVKRQAWSTALKIERVFISFCWAMK